MSTILAQRNDNREQSIADCSPRLNKQQNHTCNRLEKAWNPRSSMVEAISNTSYPTSQNIDKMLSIKDFSLTSKDIKDHTQKLCANSANQPM
jgi:hypothetical protein